MHQVLEKQRHFSVEIVDFDFRWNAEHGRMDPIGHSEGFSSSRNLSRWQAPRSFCVSRGDGGEETAERGAMRRGGTVQEQVGGEGYIYICIYIYIGIYMYIYIYIYIYI